MMLEAGVPISFWYEACKTAVFLTNRTVSASLGYDRTPYEVWFLQKPALKHLRVWGCMTYIHTRKELRDTKFAAVASEGALLGFEDNNFNYHVYDLKSRKVVVTHNAKFDEDVFPFINRQSSSTSHDNHIQQNEDLVTMKFLIDESDLDEESDGEVGEANLESGTSPTDVHLEATSEDVLPTQPTTDKSKATTTRNSSRLAGKIPNYRGMSAVSHDCSDHNLENPGVIEMSALSAQFNCLPECLNTEAVDPPHPSLSIKPPVDLRVRNGLKPVRKKYGLWRRGMCGNSSLDPPIPISFADFGSFGKNFLQTLSQ